MHDVPAAKLKGTCDGATHTVRTANVGAFARTTGTQGEVNAAVGGAKSGEGSRLESQARAGAKPETKPAATAKSRRPRSSLARLTLEGVGSDGEEPVLLMFRHQGPSRSARHNRVLAGYLAFVGGFVNSAGYVLIGSFTSHVTGNVGRLANDLAGRRYDASAAVVAMVIAFFGGAFLASMAIESNFFGRTANGYAAALLGEAALLLLFTVISRFALLPHPRVQDAEAAILCAAMGMQNSLVTRLSGAVVRTTHLTGVFTDLGIEAARWFRWWRGRMSETLRFKLSFGRNPPERPSPLKVSLLSTIAATFILGAMAGALLVGRLQHATMILPSAAVVACAVYAFVSGRRASGQEPGEGPDALR